MRCFVVSSCHSFFKGFLFNPCSRRASVRELCRLVLLTLVAAATPRGVAGTLVGTFTPVPSNSIVNLTTNGPVDWVHWGTFSEFASDRKAGVTPVIGEYTSFGGTAAQGPFRFTDNFNGYGWNDGTPHSVMTNTTTGVYEIGRNNGLQFTVPADT